MKVLDSARSPTGASDETVIAARVMRHVTAAAPARAPRPAAGAMSDELRRAIHAYAERSAGAQVVGESGGIGDVFGRRSTLAFTTRRQNMARARRHRSTSLKSASQVTS